MFKYNITNYKEFMTCINKGRSVYIEKYEDGNPIPEFYGVITSGTHKNDNETKYLAVADRGNNLDMPKRRFIKNIFTNLKALDYKLHPLEKSFEIYELFVHRPSDIINNNFNLVVIDNIEKIIYNIED